MAHNPIKVLLADDHPLVRGGVRAGLSLDKSIQVVGEASNGEEAVEMAKKLSPDILLMDISMPKMGGFEAAKYLKKTLPKVKCIILSMHEDKEYVRQMMQSGAKGYLLKDCDPQDILRAIHAVYAGKTFFSQTISDTILSDVVDGSGQMEGPSRSRLTSRESEVLALLAEGLSNKEAASKLKIGLRTVETHRERIMSKLDIHNVAGLIRYALKKGITRLK